MPFRSHGGFRGGREEGREEGRGREGRKREGRARGNSLLDVLSRQHSGPGGHLRMHQAADSVVLSQSATTRLVSRLEDRGLLSRYLCDTDRRGIYTEVSAAGLALLDQARPTNDTALREALDEAEHNPDLALLVAAVRNTPAGGRDV
ncbi:MarR family winged helix-turn-helix transcriptional regulator [Streptomyces sp. NPDC099050]|uniref:MarR family winged helix-turn-helix transcriptional regulator n=1 Tax=Streptomyces sp. NPDC099050 TaxID=3366100 RepID=UPI0037F46F2E